MTDLQQLAKQKGGQCLSERYDDFNMRLVWQCTNGHIWEARYLNIKKGHWCPICARVKQRVWNKQTPR